MALGATLAPPDPGVLEEPTSTLVSQLGALEQRGENESTPQSTPRMPWGSNSCM